MQPSPAGPPSPRPPALPHGVRCHRLIFHLQPRFHLQLPWTCPWGVPPATPPPRPGGRMYRGQAENAAGLRRTEILLVQAAGRQREAEGRRRGRPAQRCPRSRRAGTQTGLGESRRPRAGVCGGTARAAHRREVCVWPARSAAAAGRERTAGERGAGSGRGCSAAGARGEAPRQHPLPRCRPGSPGSSRRRGRHQDSSGPGGRAGKRGGEPGSGSSPCPRRPSGLRLCGTRVPTGAVRRRAAVGARTHRTGTRAAPSGRPRPPGSGGELGAAPGQTATDASNAPPAGPGPPRPRSGAARRSPARLSDRNGGPRPGAAARRERAPPARPPAPGRGRAEPIPAGASDPSRSQPSRRSVAARPRAPGAASWGGGTVGHAPLHAPPLP